MHPICLQGGNVGDGERSVSTPDKQRDKFV